MKDYTGQTFGRLTVIRRIQGKKLTGKYKYEDTRYECMCRCGNTTVVMTGDLGRASRKGTRSCGCLVADAMSEAKTTHGMTGHILIHTYNNMIKRCLHKHSKFYKNYGGRGITICDRWLESPLNFIKDMGDKPTNRHTLERIDNDKGYSPDNCKWATRKEQSRNTRRNINITFNGKTQCLADWAEECGINRNALLLRLKRGWGIERALMQPVRNY